MAYLHAKAKDAKEGFCRIDYQQPGTFQFPSKLFSPSMVCLVLYILLFLKDF
jgi:hypothetical protein